LDAVDGNAIGGQLIDVFGTEMSVPGAARVTGDGHFRHTAACHRRCHGRLVLGRTGVAGRLACCARWRRVRSAVPLRSTAMRGHPRSKGL
jgi:hypothetical protein